MPATVFISYSPPDIATAEAIQSVLESASISAFMAPRRNISTPDDPEADINSINASRVVILVLSHASNTSALVHREVEQAIARGIPVLAFRIEEVSLSKALEYLLSVSHWLDALTQPIQPHLQRLVRAIPAIVAASSVPEDIGSHAPAAPTASQEDLPAPQNVAAATPAPLPASPSTNLPRQVNAFIGREKERAQVKALLETTSLLTLIGTGGAGKTRLARQVAAELLPRFANGVWLVELAALSDARLVAHTVAQALGLREEPGRSIMDSLLDHLRCRQLLLLLDNCEHLIEACANLVEALLQSCEGLTILATSREPLKVPGEQPWAVPPLSQPDILPGPAENLPARLMEFDAIRLFVERAGAQRHDFALTRQNAAAVAQICRHLDGIPLAIELAAARVKALQVEQITDRLNDRFRLLTGGHRTALPRHQTLKALIDWSYDLLTDTEQTLLCRLAVFVGGWTLEAAEAVCSSPGEEKGEWKKEKAGDDSLSPCSFFLFPEEILDLLGSLVDKSLLVYEEQEGSARYRLLETIRQYSAERLGEDAPQFHERHARYYLGLAQEWSPKLLGGQAAQAMQTLTREIENLRAGMDWAVRQADYAAASTWGNALTRFLLRRGLYDECDTRLYSAEEAARACGDRKLLAVLLNRHGLSAMERQDYEAARPRFEESYAISKQEADAAGMLLVLPNLGHIAWGRSEFGEARRIWEEALTLAVQSGEPRREAMLRENLGILAVYRGDFAQAIEYFDASLSLYQSEDYEEGIASVNYNLYEFYHRRGDVQREWKVLQESLRLFLSLGNQRMVTFTKLHIGVHLLEQGQLSEAQAILKEELETAQELGVQQAQMVAYEGLGRLMTIEGDYDLASKYFRRSFDMADQVGDRMHVASLMESIGEMWNRQGDQEKAYLCFSVSLREYDRLQVVDASRVRPKLESLRGALAEHTERLDKKAVRLTPGDLFIERELLP